MNQPPSGPPPYGPGGHPHGGYPPPGQQPPPARSGSGRTLAWLAAGLVVVLVAIGVVALVVLGGDDEGDGGRNDDKASSGALKDSCEVYRDVVWSDQTWAATDVDPDRVQEMYDAVLADVTDEDLKALVTTESEIAVDYYRTVEEWKQSMEDALGRGETPDTALPAELTEQRAELTAAQGDVIEACKDVLPEPEDRPRPSITAPPLDRPSWMDED